MPNLGLTFNSNFNFRFEHIFSSMAIQHFNVNFFFGEDSMFKIEFPITTSS
jgi:hypothetical protein